MNKLSLRKTSAIVSVSFVFIMFIIKIFAYKYSDSVSVLASLVDSGSDIFTSIITAVAVFTASRPADNNHRFGHGKAESIGALFQSMFIFISAILLIWEAVRHIIEGYQVKVDGVIFTIMIVSLCLTLFLVIFQRYVISKTNSIAIKADNVNYTGDIFTTLGVILSIVLVKYTEIKYIDAVFGVMIALFLCVNAKELFNNSVNILMDKEVDMDFKLKIKEEIKNYPGVLGFHDFRSRFCGYTYFIEVDVELNGDLLLKEAHDIVDKLKKQIVDSREENIELIIHQDTHGKRKK